MEASSVPRIPAPAPLRLVFADQRLGRAVQATALIGGCAALAWVFWVIGDQPVAYDALGYVTLARLLAADQLDVAELRKWNWDFRTYGYPAFVLLWGTLVGNDAGALQRTIVLPQLAVHLAASWLFARRVARAFGDDRLGRLTLVLVALNPFLLIMAGLLLSDLLSAALIAVAIGLLLPPRTDRPSTASVLRDGALALFALTLAAEVRPANAALLPIGGLFWTIRWWHAAHERRRQLVGGLALVAAVAALPLIPQVLLNVRITEQARPLIAATSLYASQLSLGLPSLKHVTLTLRDHRTSPTTTYANPFWTGETDFASFAQANPPGLAATIALRAFALFDQDYPFTYVREVDPWYRWPLSAFNYLYLWGVALGIVVGRRSWWQPGTRLAWLVLLTVSATYLAVYLPPIVECRYGLPLFTLLAPFVGMALLAVHGWVKTRAWRPIGGAGVGALLTVLACAGLSVWIQAQAPTLVMLREFFRAPGPEVPAAAFALSPPARWTAEQQQTYTVRATNLGERSWYSTQPARVFLHVMFVGPGGAETVDSRVELLLPIDRDVPPGGQLELEARVTAPRKEGSYLLRHQLELDKDLGLRGGALHDTAVVVDERRSDGRDRRR